MIKIQPATDLETRSQWRTRSAVSLQDQQLHTLSHGQAVVLSRASSICAPRTTRHDPGARRRLVDGSIVVRSGQIGAAGLARPTTSSARSCNVATGSSRNSRHQRDSSRTTFPSNNRTDSRTRIQRHNTAWLQWRRTYSVVERAAAVGPENKHQSPASLPATGRPHSRL